MCSTASRLYGSHFYQQCSHVRQKCPCYICLGLWGKVSVWVSHSSAVIWFFFRFSAWASLTTTLELRNCISSLCRSHPGPKHESLRGPAKGCIPHPLFRLRFENLAGVIFFQLKRKINRFLTFQVGGGEKTVAGFQRLASPAGFPLSRAWAHDSLLAG